MRGGEGGRVVLDRRGGKDLAPAGGVEHVHFVGRASEGADLAGAPETPERSKGGGAPPGRPFLLVLGGFGVDKIHGDGLDAEFRDVGEAGNGPGGEFVVRGAGIVRTRSANAFVESREDLGGLGGWHVEKTAPDVGEGETAGCEARHDAEIVGAAFEGTPEIGIGGCGGGGDGAGGKHDFVDENVGADQAEAGGEERDTPCSCLCVSSGTEKWWSFWRET